MSKTYWYQCQERAMAPGSGDGWPEIIKAPHSKNARLVRRDTESPDELARLLAKIRQLAIDADSELSAIAHGRPAQMDECRRLSKEFRCLYEGPAFLLSVRQNGGDA